MKEIIEKTDRYNLHSHTEYCDGHAPVATIVDAACRRGFEYWGVTPHSPLPIESPCNMLRVDVRKYLDRMDELKEQYSGRMELLTGMEIDFLSRDFGPHVDYFREMPLDYRIGSVHFVPNQEGVFLDCDGSFRRFEGYLRRGYDNDLRYVVEKYFEQVLTMLEEGGFEILGHFDKIAGNASQADPEIEQQGWYGSLVSDVIRVAKDRDIIVEINTKSYEKSGRFYPAVRWWEELVESGVTIAVNSDCHDPKLTNSGRETALKTWKGIAEEAQNSQKSHQ